MGKASWNSDASIVHAIMATPSETATGLLGDVALTQVTEEDAEAVMERLDELGRANSTWNHYVWVLKKMSRWAVKKKYRATGFVEEDSDIIQRRKGRQRNRRLQDGEEQALLRVASPHLQRMIIGALETCCRRGELLSLQRRDTSLARREILLRASNTKDEEDRLVPISDRLHAALSMAETGPDGKKLGPETFVFGDEIGGRVASITKAWRTAVLKAHGKEVHWVPGKGKLTPECQAAYRAIDLHFHDLRHEGASRLLEGRWELHDVRDILGHASVDQTSTYLNTTKDRLKEKMRRLDQARRRRSCKRVASAPGVEPRPPRKDDATEPDKLLVN